jgi:hypothetical protein
MSDFSKVLDQIKDIDGTDLRPNYRLQNDSIKITEQQIKLPPPSEEDLRMKAEFEKKTILKRGKNFKDGVCFYDNFQRLNIELIQDVPAGWNLFDPPKPHELADLIRSVETVGLINPIYVIVNSFGYYNVICGRSRLLAFLNLFQSTGLEKYKFIPSYVINAEEVDELFLRTMIIESNLNFRSISKFNLIQSLITQYEIMKRAKLYRNDANIAEEVAKTFEVSETCVFNYMKVKNLCNEALTLLYEDRIKLKTAIYLARVPKEMQLNILERFGIKGVNTIFKLKLLTCDGDISIEKLDDKIKYLETFTPPKTRITIEVSREFLAKLIDCLIELKDQVIIPFACKNTRGKTSSVFKVRFNSEDMEHYFKEKVVDEKIYKKLISAGIK